MRFFLPFFIVFSMQVSSYAKMSTLDFYLMDNAELRTSLSILLTAKTGSECPQMKVYATEDGSALTICSNGLSFLYDFDKMNFLGGKPLRDLIQEIYGGKITGSQNGHTVLSIQIYNDKQENTPPPSNTNGNGGLREAPETRANIDPENSDLANTRSLLIEEQSKYTGGAVPFSGKTKWTREVNELGLPTIRATASIPARNLSVDLLIRKNSDKALPASHLIEVNFSVTDSFLEGSIASLPGVLMKNQELAQGTTLVGASVRIVDNSFLFAMSGAENDMARNIELLRQNGWLDLPLIYGTGSKAILTLEKGLHGAELFEEVLAEWAEY